VHTVQEGVARRACEPAAKPAMPGAILVRSGSGSGSGFVWPGRTPKAKRPVAGCCGCCSCNSQSGRRGETENRGPEALCALHKPQKRRTQCRAKCGAPLGSASGGWRLRVSGLAAAPWALVLVCPGAQTRPHAASHGQHQRPERQLSS
jgi:hypothetical protein